MTHVLLYLPPCPTPQMLTNQEFLQELRKIHTDTFDCIILYLAVGFADYFITMYDSLKETVYLPHFV
ncbi:MAG: hypothetical protein JW776_09270 [Candidatus Lokiarchaeota archaeon]|nr:hypothetical protein [Candidatus Lokiarchaeota archaeon]